MGPWSDEARDGRSHRRSSPGYRRPALDLIRLRSPETAGGFDGASPDHRSTGGAARQRLASVGIGRRTFLLLAAGLAAMGPLASTRSLCPRPRSWRPVNGWQRTRRCATAAANGTPTIRRATTSTGTSTVRAYPRGGPVSMKVTADFQPVPYVASKGSSNKDGSVWTFEIRKGASGRTRHGRHEETRGALRESRRDHPAGRRIRAGRVGRELRRGEPFVRGVERNKQGELVVDGNLSVDRLTKIYMVERARSVARPAASAHRAREPRVKPTPRPRASRAGTTPRAG
jgi:hypothetical protein